MPTGQLLHLGRHNLPEPSPPAEPVHRSREVGGMPARTLCIYVDARDAEYLAELVMRARLATLAGAAPAVTIAPRPTARGYGLAAADAGRFLTTLLITDIIDSTRTVARMGDAPWTQLREEHYADCRAEVAAAGGDLIETTGDGILATFDTPTRALRAGLAIQSAARHRGIGVRAGVHAGECERTSSGVAGVTVHIAARICALGDADGVMTSGTVHDLVAGSDLVFDACGPRRLRGVPGEWTLLRVVEERDR